MAAHDPLSGQDDKSPSFWNTLRTMLKPFRQIAHSAVDELIVRCYFIPFLKASMTQSSLPLKPIRDS